MSDLQGTNFNGFPDFTEQEADVLQQSIQPPTTPSPTSGNDKHCTDDEYRDLFEPDTAIPSIEPSTPAQVKNENAEAFANNNTAYGIGNEASAELLMPAHVDGLKTESADPALFSTEDMDAIFGKSTLFDDNFKMDDSYKLDLNSPLPMTSDGRHTTTHALGSPFKPNTKLDYTYIDDMRVSSDEQLQAHAPPLHPQQHMQPPQNRLQEMYPEFAHASMIDDPQLAVYRFPDGRRRSHTVPPEIRLGMRPPANMGYPHPHQQQHPHPHRQQQSTPQPQFHRVMAEHRHHPMTPPPPHMRHHVPSHGFGRGQPVFHRQMEQRGRQVSPEPKRKRQKVGHHIVEAPVRDPVSHLFESMMGNVEFVVRQGLAGMKYRMDDEFERFFYPLPCFLGDWC